MTQILIQGMTLNDFFDALEKASYNGQKRAIEEAKSMNAGIDWNKYKSLMSAEDICDIFPIKKRTAMNWITSKEKFGDYTKTGKLLFVSKSAVQKYYESTLIKLKR